MAKFLLRMTPLEMGKALGLPSRSLANGAVIFSFLRLPTITEASHELTTHYPGGLAFGPSSSPNYLPGSKTIHQWCVNAPKGIPINTSNIVYLTATERFQG